jgi:hypothetical protein
MIGPLLRESNRHLKIGGMDRMIDNDNKSQFKWFDPNGGGILSSFLIFGYAILPLHRIECGWYLSLTERSSG